jgi:hypothetical protein
VCTRCDTTSGTCVDTCPASSTCCPAAVGTPAGSNCCPATNANNVPCTCTTTTDGRPVCVQSPPGGSVRSCPGGQPDCPTGTFCVVLGGAQLCEPPCL